MQAAAGVEAVTSKVQPDDVTLWRAVVERDARWDGRFVYAVESTTVYCRPSCPSRRPQRQNVRFLPSAAAAERQGYRACRRCQPQAALGPGEAVVERVRAMLAPGVEPTPTLSQLAKAVSLSPGHLQRLFKRHTGLSPKAYVESHRFRRLKAALRSEGDVSAAIYAAGYQAPSRAYERTRGQLGMTPSAYRAGGAGQRISYAVAQSSLGRTLVATTARGVCRVAFGDSDAALVSELRAEYPEAALVPAGSAQEAWVQQVVGSVDTPWTSPSVPLDVQGTAFQQRVWKALKAIPTGHTLSYGEVAKRIGAPTSARAVARACATNPVAVLIPCHRVVSQDGRVGGYRWGTKRKAQLLAEESAKH